MSGTIGSACHRQKVQDSATIDQDSGDPRRPVRYGPVMSGSQLFAAVAIAANSVCTRPLMLLI